MQDPFDPFPQLGRVENRYAEYEYGHDNDETGDVLAESEEARPLPWLYAAIILAVSVLGLRLGDLQIVEAARNRVLAEGNRVRSREVRPPRGEIRDRTGVVLAGNTAAYTLEIFPAELPRNREEREAALDAVQAATSLDVSPVKEQIREKGLSLNPMAIADQIPREQAIIWDIKLADLPGVRLSKLPDRTYSPIPGLGHILGYVGTVSEKDKERWPSLSLLAQVGKSGLEVSYEEQLQGKVGEERVEVDAKGRVERILSRVEPTQGESLVLTLDSDLQTSLMNHLAEQATKRQVSKAAAVVLDAKTGGVLAMASLPDYDPNVFIRRDRQADRLGLLQNGDQPLLNRTIAGTYPSGSTLKPVIAAAALAAGTISAATRLDTSAGAIQIGQWRFPDWKVHGVADVKRAIAESNDIFFYAVGGGYESISGLGPTRMHDWLQRFGFGGPTGIDLPGEAGGLVPDDAWKRSRIKEPWYIGDSYHLAIGQGYFLATPLQLARAIAAIANGGQLVTPHLLKERIGPDGVTAGQFEATAVANVGVDGGYLQTVREGMRLTITDGTARSLGEVPVPVAGKTGTAQFNNNQQTHSWFVGFAPYDNPEIAIAVLVEGGGESSDSAVPAAKSFLLDWAAKRNTQ